MDTWDSIADILFYLAPALLVFGMAYLMIKKFLDTNQRVKMIELKMSLQKELIPMRMQAFERAVLYLERISPNNLLIRVYEPGLSSGEFHRELLNTIRSEYEHNVTQQVYMSNSSWAAVRQGRDELVKVINMAAERSGPNAPGAELSKHVFQIMMDEENFPVQKAIDQVKSEAYSLF